MTNLHTKLRFFIIAALLITLVGCKKDETTGSAFTLDTYSIDFEWGQTKELGFTVDNVTGFGTPTTPSGWSCTLSGDKYIITAPAEGATGESTGKIEVSATTGMGTTLTRTITVSVRIAEEITRVANSIIVSEPGKRFKFDARNRAGVGGQTITGATRALRVWTTSTAAISNVSLEGGYLYFATGTDTEVLKEANAVVAVTDADGNVLWSWHIWVTDYDPDNNPDMVGDFRVMNRNLGAFANSDATPQDAVRSYGLYYQWGRKDPFVGPVAWDSTTPITIYNYWGQSVVYDYVVSSEDTGTVEYAIANPGTFIAGDEKNGFDWLSTSNPNLWGGASKTIYDPCPAGWRVAPPTIWAGFTKTGEASTDPAEFSVEGGVEDYLYGWKFYSRITVGDIIFVNMKPIFYPAAGRRNFSPTLASSSRNFTNVVNDSEGVGYPVGFYWSSTHPATLLENALYPPHKGSGTLAFRRDYVNPANFTNSLPEYAPAGGFPLRCVAE